MVKGFKKYCPKVFELEDDKATYEWWREMLLINGFNKARKAASYMKVRDDSTSAISFWKTAKGNLTHLYYIFCNTEPMWTEFKTVTCSVTGVLIFTKVQRGK